MTYSEPTPEEWAKVHIANQILGHELNARIAAGHERLLLQHLRQAGYPIPDDWRKSLKASMDVQTLRAYNILEEVAELVESIQ